MNVLKLNLRGWLGVSVLAVALASGCQTQSKQAGTPKFAGESPAAARSEFERTGDPPFTAETHIAAAQLAEAQSNPASAIDQYQNAIKLEPKNTTALYRLGIVFAQQKR